MKVLAIVKSVRILSAIDIVGLCFVLLTAFVLQIRLHELPCPLCILQRIGILGIAFGFLLNIQFKIRPSHYTLSLLAALFTATVSMRQIFLHIVPGMSGYGPPLLGIHLYTWVFLLCVGAIIYIAVILSIFPQYSETHVSIAKNNTLQTALMHLAFALLLLLAVSNGISTYLECGFEECPENPANYKI